MNSGAAHSLLFSIYQPPVWNKIPDDKPTNIIQVYQTIRGDTLKAITERIRQQPDEKEQKRLKEKFLPYVTFTGTFSMRQDSAIISRSGLICCDVDHLTDVEGVRELILGKLKPALLFRSPRGNGLKVVYRIAPEAGTHGEYFSALASYFKTEIGPSLDNTPDISRACFLCHDPDAFYSDDPDLLDVAFLDTFLEPKPKKPLQVAVHEHTTDENLSSVELFERGKRWADRKDQFVEGNRHNYITSLAGYCHRVGIMEQESLTFLQEFASTGFTEKEIAGIVTRTYRNAKYAGAAKMRGGRTQEAYLTFPLRLLWVAPGDFKFRVWEIMEGHYKWIPGEPPTSVKKSYLADAMNGKLAPELLLLLAAAKSIIGNRNFTKTGNAFIVERMFGGNPWRRPTRYWLDQLFETAMVRGILAKVPDRRGYYISIKLKPDTLSKAVIESLKYKADKRSAAQKASQEIADFKKSLQG